MELSRNIEFAMLKTS